MAPRFDTEDDWDDEIDDDADGTTMPCPYCGRSIHEDSVRCPHCESYISEEDRRAERKSLWLVAAVIACLLAVLTWILIG
jgi:predicted nucleic acid-binding Zn ribbon protein